MNLIFYKIDFTIMGLRAYLFTKYLENRIINNVISWEGTFRVLDWIPRLTAAQPVSGWCRAAWSEQTRSP